MASSALNPLRFFGTAEGLGLAGLLVLTVVVRGSVLWAMRGNLEQDPDAYRQIAENLLRHGEFALTGYRGIGGVLGSESVATPTAYRPPLYPVVLSNLPTTDGLQVSLTKVAVLHLLLGVGTVWLTWATARRVLPGPASQKLRLTHPTVAGFLVACDPILLNQQTLTMTETLAVFLAILSLWCLARFDGQRSWFDAALAGGAIGLAVLCRSTFLPWLLFVAITLLLIGDRRDFRFWILDFGLKGGGNGSHRPPFTSFAWRIANVVAFSVLAAGVMSPWVIRNYRVFGRPIITTTHGGYTLYLGNNESFYQYLAADKSGLPWKAPSIDLGIIASADDSLPTEMVIDQTFYRYAQFSIRNSPSSFLYACAYRLWQLWSPLPHKLTADESLGRRLLRYGTCAWYCGAYALMGAGIWRLRGALLRPPLIWGMLLCAAFTAVHTVYWTNLRMRAPLMPFVAMVAAAGAASFRFQVSSSDFRAEESQT